MTKTEREEVERARAFVHTSVDDLRSSLPHENRASVLIAAFQLCLAYDYKTKARLLARRLKELHKLERKSAS